MRNLSATAIQIIIITKKQRKFIRGDKGLLKEALNILRAEGEAINDSFGTVGYRIEQYILVAKDYIYSGIVSCHKMVLTGAMKEGKHILFYIGQSKSFYSFNPHKVHEQVYFFQKGYVNKRGTVTMVNFPVSLGVRFNPVAEYQLTLF